MRGGSSRYERVAPELALRAGTDGQPEVVDRVEKEF